MIIPKYETGPVETTESVTPVTTESSVTNYNPNYNFKNGSVSKFDISNILKAGLIGYFNGGTLGLIMGVGDILVPPTTPTYKQVN